MRLLSFCSFLPLVVLSSFVLGCSGDDGSSSGSSGSGGSSKEPADPSGSSGPSGSPSSGEQAAPSESSAEGEDVFAASGTPTPGTVPGVWAMPDQVDSGVTFEGRIRFTATQAISAVRCSAGEVSVIAGVTVKASVSATKIALLEGKSDKRTAGKLECSTSMRAFELKACEPGGTFDCFAVEGTTLRMYGQSPGEMISYKKVAN